MDYVGETGRFKETYGDVTTKELKRVREKVARERELERDRRQKENEKAQQRRQRRNNA